MAVESRRRAHVRRAGCLHTTITVPRIDQRRSLAVEISPRSCCYKASLCRAQRGRRRSARSRARYDNSDPRVQTPCSTVQVRKSKKRAKVTAELSDAGPFTAPPRAKTTKKAATNPTSTPKRSKVRGLLKQFLEAPIEILVEVGAVLNAIGRPIDAIHRFSHTCDLSSYFAYVGRRKTLERSSSTETLKLFGATPVRRLRICLLAQTTSVNLDSRT